MKVGPHVGTELAAGSADEPRFKVGRPDVFRPLIGADLDPMRALVVGARPRTPEAPISRNVIFWRRSVTVTNPPLPRASLLIVAD